MDLPAPYPGGERFVMQARRAGHALFVVSHKTRHPILGERHDLHAAARGFLADRGLVGGEMIAPENVFFEVTKEDKVARAAALGVDVFIDDLPEILTMPGFPSGLRAILFEPDGNHEGPPFERHGSSPSIAPSHPGLFP